MSQVLHGSYTHIEPGGGRFLFIPRGVFLFRMQNRKLALIEMKTQVCTRFIVCMDYRFIVYVSMASVFDWTVFHIEARTFFAHTLRS